ncbi:MAG: hypothetical protein AB1791_22125 [Chloroflexota bacterium]
MKLSLFLLIAGILGLGFGIALVLMPAGLLALYGMTVDTAGQYVARLFGAALLDLGVLSLMARNAPDSPARQALIMAGVVGNLAGLIVTLLGQLAGVTNALGWSTVVIYLFLTAGFAYFQFMKKAA